MRDSFMFFRNMRDIIKSVPRELQLELREAIEDYVFDGVEPTDWAFKAIIQSIKPSLEYVGRGAPKGNQNAKKEEIEEVKNNSKQIKQKNQLNEIELFETKKQEAKAETKEETKDLNNITPKNIFSDENIILSPYKGNENCSSDCERRAKFEINGQKFCGQHTRIELSKLGRLDLIPAERFIKPTIEEIKSYCLERNNGVDPQKFFDYYTANGWKVGKNPMKDWRAAVRTWEKGSVAAPDNRETGNYEPTPEQQAEKQLMLEAIRRTEELQKKRIEARYGSLD